MATIKMDSGAGYGEALRDARPLVGVIGDACKGQPVQRVAVALVLCAATLADRAGMTEEEFVTYARQQFAFAQGARQGRLAEVVRDRSIG